MCDPNMIFWGLRNMGLGFIFGSSPRSTQSLSSRVQLAPFYCYCSSWWSFNPTDICKIAGVPYNTCALHSPTASPNSLQFLHPCHKIKSLSCSPCSPCSLHAFKVSTTCVALTLLSSMTSSRFNLHSLKSTAFVF